MNIRDDIHAFSAEEDKPILLWLLSKYSMQSEWFFVAGVTLVPYGKYSYQVNRKWWPTNEGRVLYAHREELE